MRQIKLGWSLVPLLLLPALCRGADSPPQRLSSAHLDCRSGLLNPRSTFESAGRVRVPNGLSRDVGDVAVLVDNGLMIRPPETRFDLPQPVLLRFSPAGTDAQGDARYTVLVKRAMPVEERPLGARLTFLYPAATLGPLDDDTQEVPCPGGFPFFGTTYHSAWVNVDGNLTFGEPDFASDDRSAFRHVSGPPRVAPFFLDLDLNLGGAVYASGDDFRLDVSWVDVPAYGTPNSRNTFRVSLYSDGRIDLLLQHVEPQLQPGGVEGVIGIAEGGFEGPDRRMDFSSFIGPNPTAPLTAGAIYEEFGFGLPFIDVDVVEVAREFYRTHPDHFDTLVVFWDFPRELGQVFPQYNLGVQNHTHGLGIGDFDDSAFFGSAGELEDVISMNRIDAYWPTPQLLVDPTIWTQPYDLFPNTGLVEPPGVKPSTRSRLYATANEDYTGHGKRIRNIDLYSGMSLMGHEVGHRWGTFLQFKHPVTGVGPDSDDLRGPFNVHWSFFANTRVSPTQFAGEPRSASQGGNVLQDLGPSAFGLQAPAGQRFFLTAPDQLTDGYSELDQYLMGLRRAAEVSPFWYVDTPGDPYDGRSLDYAAYLPPFSPSRFFRGTRVDLTIQDVQAHPAMGPRFWGPSGPLTLAYDDSGRVVPGGSHHVTLTEDDRRLGDEADAIDAQGKPVDVRSMAFILLVRDDPSNHQTAIRQMDTFRRTWESYANGPATGSRGRFSASLRPLLH